VVDVSTVRSILSRIRRVVSGDVILPEDHNLQTDAVTELTNVVESISLVAPPPPPLSVVSRQPLHFSTLLNNVSNNPENAVTESYTIVGSGTLSSVARRMIISIGPVFDAPPEFGFDCGISQVDATVVYMTVKCPVSLSYRFMMNGNPMPSDTFIVDNISGAQYQVWLEGVATPNCPPCNPSQCPYGCTNYRWLKPWNLGASLNVFAGTNVEGDVAIRDVIPGPCYGIVTDLNTDLYDFVVDGVVRTFYTWRDSAGDIVAYLPQDFKLRGGEVLELRVKPGMGGGLETDYAITRLDYLIT
jgi:hypothetical protein